MARGVAHAVAHAVAHGVVPGLIAAVIALVMYFVAIFVATAGALSKLFEVSFMDSLRAAVEYPGEVLSGYFSDGLSYVFFGVSVLAAFYYAWGGRQAKPAPEQPEELPA